MPLSNVCLRGEFSYLTRTGHLADHPSKFPLEAMLLPIQKTKKEQKENSCHHELGRELKASTITNATIYG